jgi:DNA-directed RNA polymerase specialized sigma24 family protein
MSIEEVSEHLGLKPGNVRVLLHRARAAFLKSMTASELEQARDEDAPARARLAKEHR